MSLLNSQREPHLVLIYLAAVGPTNVPNVINFDSSRGETPSFTSHLTNIHRSSTKEPFNIQFFFTCCHAPIRHKGDVARWMDGGQRSLMDCADTRDNLSRPFLLDLSSRS
ncbi:hypothetical protein L202_06028, partial [Cryptococcus amylolentus CBS 6039]